MLRAGLPGSLVHFACRSLFRISVIRNFTNSFNQKKKKKNPFVPHPPMITVKFDRVRRRLVITQRRACVRTVFVIAPLRTTVYQRTDKSVEPTANSGRRELSNTDVGNVKRIIRERAAKTRRHSVARSNGPKSVCVNSFGTLRDAFDIKYPTGAVNVRHLRRVPLPFFHRNHFAHAVNADRGRAEAVVVVERNK